MGKFLQLPLFDLRRIKNGSTIVVIGGRGSGKTTVVLDILFHEREIPFGIIMSGTEDGNEQYGSMVPPGFTFGEYNEKIIKNLMNHQRRYKKECRPPVFLLLDDLGFNKKIWHSELIRKLFMNGRHFNITIIVTFQYIMNCPPEMRANTDYVFALKQNSHENVVKVHKSFFTCVQKKDQFARVIAGATRNHECLVAVNKTSADSIKNQELYYYKAQLRAPFRIGCKSWWQNATNMVHKKAAIAASCATRSVALTDESEDE